MIRIHGAGRGREARSVGQIAGQQRLLRGGGQTVQIGSLGRGRDRHAGVAAALLAAGVGAMAAGTSRWAGIGALV